MLFVALLIMMQQPLDVLDPQYRPPSLPETMQEQGRRIQSAQDSIRAIFRRLRVTRPPAIVIEDIAKQRGVAPEVVEYFVAPSNDRASAFGIPRSEISRGDLGSVDVATVVASDFSKHSPLFLLETQVISRVTATGVSEMRFLQYIWVLRTGSALASINFGSCDLVGGAAKLELTDPFVVKTGEMKTTYYWDREDRESKKSRNDFTKFRVGYVLTKAQFDQLKECAAVDVNVRPIQGSLRLPSVEGSKLKWHEKEVNRVIAGLPRDPVDYAPAIARVKRYHDTFPSEAQSQRSAIESEWMLVKAVYNRSFRGDSEADVAAALKTHLASRGWSVSRFQPLLRELGAIVPNGGKESIEAVWKKIENRLK